jgi:hypothetical protein
VTEPRWDPERPLPPDEGPHHTHTAHRIKVSSAKAAPGSDEVPEGEWRVLLILFGLNDIAAGHGLARIMTPAAARTVAAALIQAAGDVESGRVADAYPEDAS